MCYTIYDFGVEWGFAMTVSQDKLWKLLIDRKMNRTELKEASGISSNVMAKKGYTLNCDIGEVVSISKNISEV